MELSEKRKKNKGGRPGLGARRKSHQIKVNVSETEYETLSNKAAAIEMSVTEYVRETSLQGYIKAIHTPEAKAQRTDFIRLSNNLNQLTKQAHIQGLKSLIMRFEDAMNEINVILKKYKA